MGAGHKNELAGWRWVRLAMRPDEEATPVELRTGKRAALLGERDRIRYVFEAGWWNTYIHQLDEAGAIARTWKTDYKTWAKEELAPRAEKRLAAWEARLAELAPGAARQDAAVRQQLADLATEISLGQDRMSVRLFDDADALLHWAEACALGSGGVAYRRDAFTFVESILGGNEQRATRPPLVGEAIDRWSDITGDGSADYFMYWDTSRLPGFRVLHIEASSSKLIRDQWQTTDDFVARHMIPSMIETFRDDITSTTRLGPL
jgi:hypothetical protein